MILTDLHSHTYPASHDAKSTLTEMVQGAVDKKLSYFGISNHFDYDIDWEKLAKLRVAPYKIGDEDAYFAEARQLQAQYKNTINLLVGAEFGFSQEMSICQRYLDTYNKYKPDYVINSIHSLDNVDYCNLTLPNDKQSVFANYLQSVRKSLDAPYHYDIVGHLEYVVRYVPFEQKVICIGEFQEQIDDILCTIIDKDKILEVNSSTYSLPRICIPNKEILQRYFALGGKKITFGSDAHSISRIADKREQIVAMLKEIGFTHLTVPFFGKDIQVKI